MNSKRLLERFLRYVAIDTTADADATGYPSSPGQLVLGRLLADELRAMGLKDVVHNEHGIVLATLPPTSGCEKAPTIAFCSHLDTSPETSGANIRPQVIGNYPGGDIPLPANATRVIRVTENPELDKLRGHTILTTDGTTLLGADDKAGVAIIMEAVEQLLEQPELAHGRVRVCFTCDEEIGHGVDKIDLAEVGAVACYTLDGHAHDEIDIETFSADLATITVHGVNIHPSIAKDRMTNAIRAAADFLGRLPRENLAPERTADRDGFLHPYEISGGVAEVKISILLRDFDSHRLAEYAALLRSAAAATVVQFPEARLEVEILRQYRNMADGLGKDSRAVEFAEQALTKLGRTAKRTIVRGGTDGSRLTEMGLPTPNLSCGGHNPHSPLEWACLEEMASSVEWVAAIAAQWAETADK